jgi:glucose-1-phosphate thymidylyltransferase
MTAGADEPSLRAVLLAAGFATRLWPLTRDRAKPLLEVGGEPMLTRLLRQVEVTGLVREALVVTNARFHRDFEDWRDELDTSLDVALVNDGAKDNESRLGAVADLDLALRRSPFEGPTDGWLVLAGDNLLDFELRPYIDRYLASGAAQLIVRELDGPPPPHKYNEVVLDAGVRVVSFREKPERSSSSLAAIAVYVLPPQLPELVAAHLAAEGARDAPGHLVERLVEVVPFEAAPIAGRWFDIGDRDDLETAREALAT